MSRANMFYWTSDAARLVGLGLIWWHLGWVVTLSVFLVVWSITLRQQAKRIEESRQ